MNYLCFLHLIRTYVGERPERFHRQQAGGPADSLLPHREAGGPADCLSPHQEAGGSADSLRDPPREQVGGPRPPRPTTQPIHNIG